MEVNYAGINLRPCLFQDDIARLADNLNAVIEGNQRTENMAETKLLDFNLQKSCLLIVGGQKFRKQILDQLKSNPVKFCNYDMKRSDCEKYLGDYLSSSLSDSVFETIKRRKGHCIKLINEIKLTIEDCRGQSLGGLLTGMRIWNMAVVPFLFYNSECWVEMPNKALKILDSIQNSFFRALFAICVGCPIPAFYWDTGSLSAKNVVIMRKLLFIHDFDNIPEDSLAK